LNTAIQNCMAMEKPEVVIDEKHLVGPSSFSFLPDENILIVDECAHQLKIFSEKGELVRKIGGKGSAKEEFTYPTDAVILGKHIYVTDRYQHKIKALDLNGVVLWDVGGYGNRETELKEPFGIATIDDHSLAVIDAGNVKVKIYDTDGKYQRSFGYKGINKEYYESQSFKKTFIYDAWVRSFERFETIDTKFYESGYSVGDMENPKGIICDGENIYVCDYSGRMQVYNKFGKISRTFYLEDSAIEKFTHMLWVQQKGSDIFFSREADNCIYRINEKGKVSIYYHAPGHYVECFKFHGDHVYFMSPWEKKLFRILCD